jgi:outer membrane murein-binding lipoprotein Lpp
MFGSRKSREEKNVEEFVTGQSAGAPADGGAAGEREGTLKTKGWLIAAVVVAAGLLALCFAAFAKIGHLSRDVALLRSQVSEKAVEDLKAQVATLSVRLGKSGSETEHLRNRIALLERDLEAMKQANAREARTKTKVPTKKGTAGKKKTRPH